MVYTRDEPAAADLLSDSQGILLNNTNAGDSSFGEDHYQFSDLTANNGKHKIIRTVSQGTDPTMHPATTTDPIYYGYQDNATLGVLQYSRGPSNAIQTPITCRQSGGTGITLGTSATSSILDFTGLPYCFGQVMAVGNGTSPFLAMGVGNFFWNGSLARVYAPIVSGTNLVNLTIEFSGAVLRINNGTGQNLTNVAWTLRFDRIYTPT